MKCNKCGEECKDNQAFCLKCGSPIQVVPDFNLIEAELASNIGELMDKIDNEEKEDTNEDETISQIEVTNMELKLVDISRGSSEDKSDDRTKVIGDINHLVKDETEETEKIQNVQPKQNTQKKNNKKKNAIIAGIVGGVLVIAVIIFVIVAQSVEKTATTYNQYYEDAVEAYDSKNGDKALEYANIALEKATNNEEILKVRELIYDIHLIMDEDGEDYADNLEKIIELGTENTEYYLGLAEYYDVNEKYSSLTRMLIGIDDNKILEALKEYVVDMPQADFDSGDYTSYMAVELEAEEGYKIYFTTDSRNPSNYGEEYKEAIQIAKEGETVIKAIAVNEKGVESKVVTFTYNVQLTGSNAPKITPSGGAYTESTKIKVEIPEGGKAYYTWDDTDPTENSTEYTEEIDMLRGINVLKVVVIDKYGIASDIAQESYNLQIPRALTLNEAVGLAENEAKKTLAEGETVKGTYETTAIIDNNEYYIVLAVITDADGKEKAMIAYGINTFDKSIELANDEEGSYSIGTKDGTRD